MADEVKNKRGRGRPAGSGTGGVHTRRWNVPVSPEQDDATKAVAAARGVTLSEYVREAAAVEVAADTKTRTPRVPRFARKRKTP